MARIGVLGIGNLLMGDDALGAHVVKRIEAAFEFPTDVSVVEAGTPGRALSTFLRGLDAAVVVDTVRIAGRAGEIRVLGKESLLAGAAAAGAGPHEHGLREALFEMEAEGSTPRDVRLVGVVPAEVAMKVGLSPQVQEAVPAAVQEVLRQLADLGVAPRPRLPPAEPDIWWERPPGGGR